MKDLLFYILILSFIIILNSYIMYFLDTVGQNMIILYTCYIKNKSFYLKKFFCKKNISQKLTIDSKNIKTIE